MCVSVLSPKEKKLHSTVTQIKSVIQVLDLIIGRFQRWRLGSNRDRLGTASTLGRGKAAERKDGGRKGVTFPNASFSFPDIPAIRHTSSSTPKLPLVKCAGSRGSPQAWWLLEGCGVSRGIEGKVQSFSPRLLHHHSSVCLLLPVLTVRQAEPFPFILHRFTSPWQASFLLLHASKDRFYASLSRLHSASRDRPGTLDGEAGQKAAEDWYCLVLAFPRWPGGFSTTQA